MPRSMKMGRPDIETIALYSVALGFFILGFAVAIFGVQSGWWFA